MDCFCTLSPFSESYISFINSHFSMLEWHKNKNKICEGYKDGGIYQNLLPIP